MSCGNAKKAGADEGGISAPASKELTNLSFAYEENQTI
jgi:hypothetical protein